MFCYYTLNYSRKNPLGLLVGLDDNMKAMGTLFWDDGDSIGNTFLFTYLFPLQEISPFPPLKQNYHNVIIIIKSVSATVYLNAALHFSLCWVR